MISIVTINGTAYNSAARAANSFDAFDELTLQLDGGYGQLVWTVSGVGPIPLFKDGMTVSLTTDGTLRFVGNIETIAHHQVDNGWAITFRALDLKHRADFATIFGSDGSGQAVYNRPPAGDNLYVSSDAGLSVGTIVQRILTIANNASVLSGYGVGAYIAPSPSPWTLPAITVAELAVLTIVPPHIVVLSGDGLFNVLEQFVQSWHPKYSLWIQPDGTIRCTDIFSMTAHALVIPGEGPGADPVTWPQLTRDTAGCFTQVVVSGVSIRPAILSIVDGTLVKGWSNADEAAWTIKDFQQPKDSNDTGALSSVTTSTCVVTSDFPAAHWVTNFWNQSNRLGWITFINPAATGIDIHESRKITSCTALTAGGTATITWDAGDPLTSFSYTRYRIVGTAGPLVDVGRLFTIREPVGPLLGLATYVGSHLVPRFPQPMPWSNNGKTFNTSVPVGAVMWSPSGVGPWFEFPIVFEVVPSTGQIRATQPVVSAFSSAATLAKGYPTTFPLGKPYDVKVMVPYNRGLLTSTAPSPGAYSGTAYTQDGITRTKYVPLDAWNYAGDSANIATLASELLAVYKDAVIEGNLTYHGVPAAFDALAFPYALTLSIATTVAGTGSPWDGLNLPVRSVSLRWPQGGGALHTVTWSLSNRKRPFQGWDLYVHPIPAREMEDFSGQEMPFDRAVTGEVHSIAGPGDLNPGVDSGSGLSLDPAAFTGGGGLGGRQTGLVRPADPRRDGKPLGRDDPRTDGIPNARVDPNRDGIPNAVDPRVDGVPNNPAVPNDFITRDTPGTGLAGSSIPFDPFPTMGSAPGGNEAHAAGLPRNPKPGAVAPIRPRERPPAPLPPEGPPTGRPISVDDEDSP